MPSPLPGFRITDLDDVQPPYSALAGGYVEVEMPLGPVAGGFINLRLRGDRLRDWIAGGVAAATLAESQFKVLYDAAQLGTYVNRDLFITRAPGLGSILVHITGSKSFEQDGTLFDPNDPDQQPGTPVTVSVDGNGAVVTGPRVPAPPTAAGDYLLRVDSAGVPRWVLYTASATPAQAAPPTAFAAGTPTATSVPLSWQGPAGATYVVQRATNAAFTAGLVTLYTGTNTNVTNSSGLSASTTYYYRVKAQVAGLADSAFATLSVTTAAAPASGVAVDNNAKLFAFTPATGNALDYGFEILP